MLNTDQLQLALLDLSKGAVVLLQASLASDATPAINLPSGIAQRAISAPLERLALLMGEEPRPPRAARPRKPRKVRKASTRSLKQGELPKPADLEDFDRVSAWDPDERPFERPYSPDSNLMLEAASCRALLLEIVRRASYDWVLYRTSSKLLKRSLAESAYHWLFVEEPSTLAWRQRAQSNKELTSFIAVCEAVGVDPERVRRRIRQLTERDIMGAGRPAERRKSKSSNEDVLQADDMRVFDVDVDSLPVYDYMYSASEG